MAQLYKQRVYTAEQMRELDRSAIEDFGIAGVVLMELAGRGVADLACSLLSEHTRVAPVVILCGGGNNGGDGFVTARHLIDRGIPTVVYLVADEKRIKGEALANLQVLRRLGLQPHLLRTDEQLKAAEPDLRDAPVIIDALLGTGLRSDVSGLLRRVIDTANAVDTIKIAVDIPTGLHADTGAVLGAVFDANHTVTFGAPKVALVSYPGTVHTGTLHVVEIGIPQKVLADKPFTATVIDDSFAHRRLQRRSRWGHKGSFGHLLVIGGSPGKSGAALMCGKSAMRSGAGVCTVAAPQEVLAALECKTVEVMLESLVLPDALLRDGPKLSERIGELLNRKSAVVVGPGMPVGKGATQFVARLLTECSVPIVLDADGINALVPVLDMLEKSNTPIVLTPHPGEFARLIQRSGEEVQRDRLDLARDFGQRYGVYVALKGPHTVIATPDGDVFINPTGNSGMGSGGTGDVLAGIIGGLLAQGNPPLDATTIGIFAHGLAGDRVARQKGSRGMIASDLIAELPAIWEKWDRPELC